MKKEKKGGWREPEVYIRKYTQHPAKLLDYFLQSNKSNINHNYAGSPNSCVLRLLMLSAIYTTGKAIC